MNILAVNPWIHDFAAADYWLKPYGFLVLLSYLKKYGHKVEYIDLLDNYSGSIGYGRQVFHSEEIPKPEVIEKVPRKFKRYGMLPETFFQKIENTDPDIILLTSTMTYWYTGLKEAYEILRKKFPEKEIYIGGNYPTLMKTHFQNIFAGAVAVDNKRMEEFFLKINTPFKKDDFFSTLPDFTDYYSSPAYAVLRTSWGCIDRCPYCAVNQLFRGYFAVKNKNIIEFINYHLKKGIVNFAFYDDALLFRIKKDDSLLLYLSQLKTTLNFHTPNAMHLRFVDEQMALYLKKAGFVMPRFGLETTNSSLLSEWGGKVDYEVMNRAALNLRKAGYQPGEFSVYILLGFPGQDLNLLLREVEELNNMGYRVFLSEFSPVPGTIMADNFNLQDPLLANNSIFNHDYQKIWSLKNQVTTLQNKNFN